MVGLGADDAEKFPSELSGGMTKRAALARALALDPEVVFLDEPTSGLDPIAAGEFDSLIKTLQRTLGLTVFMVTHDLDSLYAVCDRIAVLADGKIVVEGPIEAGIALRTSLGEGLLPRQTHARTRANPRPNHNLRPIDGNKCALHDRRDRRVGDARCGLRLRLLVEQQRRARRPHALSSSV